MEVKGHFSLWMGLSSKSGVGKLQPQQPILVSKVLLEYSHARFLAYCLWLCSHNQSREVTTETVCGTQSLKYLTSGPLQERFANPCSETGVCHEPLSCTATCREWEGGRASLSPAEDGLKGQQRFLAELELGLGQGKYQDWMGREKQGWPFGVLG